MHKINLYFSLLYVCHNIINKSIGHKNEKRFTSYWVGDYIIWMREYMSCGVYSGDGIDNFI